MALFWMQIETMANGRSKQLPNAESEMTGQFEFSSPKLVTQLKSLLNYLCGFPSVTVLGTAGSSV